MKARKPAMVLFDWDHTLVSAPIPAIEEDVEKTRRYYATEGGMSQEKIDSFDPEELDFSLPVRQIPPDFDQFKMANSVKILDFLSAKKVPLGVVSNKDLAILKLECKIIGWEHYFCAILGKDWSMPKKPAPQMLWKAAELGGMKYGDVIWFVGDSNLDTRAASAAGFIAIHYSYTHGINDATVRAVKTKYGWMRDIGDGEPGADYVISDLLDLASMFEHAS